MIGSRAWRVAVVAAIGVSLAAAVGILDPGNHAPGLILLGTGIVLGELLPLRPPLRPSIPLSSALFVVLAGEVGAARYALIVVLAELTTVCIEDGRLRARLDRAAVRLIVAAGVFVAFTAVEVLGPEGSDAMELVAALAGAVVALGIGEVARVASSRLRVGRGGPPRLPLMSSTRSADLVIVSTAVLMTATTSGRDAPGMGLWGLAFCAIPLLMAWYAMERLRAARQTYDQSIESLAELPEVVGWVPRGRAARVALLSVELGEELALERWELDRLATAALLRELGRVCLDDPSAPDPAAIADAGAHILGATEALAGAGRILSAELEPDVAPVPYATAGRILALAGAFDDATTGRWQGSRAAAASGLATVRVDLDPAMLRALERALASAGVRV